MSRSSIVAALLLWILGTPVAAEANIGGRALSVSGGCASGGTVAVDPDPSLADRVAVVGPAAAPPAAGSDGTITVVPACGDDTLRIRVPPAFPVRVEVGGDRSIHLGDLAGPVSLVSKGGTVSAGLLSGPVRIEGTGDGDMTIASLSGPTDIVLHGSGDLAVGQATIPALSLAMAGSGDVRIGGGTVARLDLVMRGSGDVRIAGTVGSGSIDDAGDGDVEINRVTGNLSEVQAGSGSITVDSRKTADADRVRSGIVTMPPMPAINVEEPHFRFRADTADDVAGLLLGVLKFVMFAAAALVAVLLLREARKRRRSASVAAMPIRLDILHLAERLDTVARRTGALEQAITSDEFDLDRRFRELGADRRA